MSMSHNQIKCLAIPGYEGKYTIYSNGVVQRNPSKYRRTTMCLKPKKDNYYRVTLYGNTGHKIFSIHRLVAMSFIPNPNNFPQVNHLDGNHYNNDVSNLEWCTPRENLIHSINILGKNRNTKKQRASASEAGKNKRKLTMEQANEIKSLHGIIPRKDLAMLYKVSVSVIDRIRMGRAYINRPDEVNYL